MKKNIFFFFALVQSMFGQNFSDSLRHSPSAVIPEIYLSTEKIRRQNKCIEDQYSADGRLLIRITKTMDEKDNCVKMQVENMEERWQGGTIDYKHDSHSNTINQIENEGDVIWTNKYNSKQQLIYTERNNRGVIDVKKEFDYDVNGNRTEARTITGATVTTKERNIYNKKNKLIVKYVEKLDGEKKTDTYNYKYDANDNCISEEVDFSTDLTIEKKVTSYYKGNNLVFRRTLFYGKCILERWTYDLSGNCIFHELDNNNDKVIDEYTTFCYDCYGGKKSKTNTPPYISDISLSVLKEIKSKLECGSATDIITKEACEKLSEFEKANTIELNSIANKRIIGYGYKLKNSNSAYKISAELLAFEYNSKTNKICLVPLNPDNEQERKDVNSAVEILRQGKKPVNPNIAYDYGRNYKIQENQWKKILTTTGKSNGVVIKNRFLGRETKEHIIFLEVDYENSTVPYTDSYIWIFMKPG